MDKNKLLRWIGLLLLALAVATFSFIWFGTKEISTPIPKETIFALGTSDITKFIDTAYDLLHSPEWRELIELVGLSRLLTRYQEIEEKMKDVFHNETVLCGILGSGQESLQVLILLKLKATALLYTKIDSTLGGKSRYIENFNGVNIREIEVKGIRFYYAIVENRFILSLDKLLLENNIVIDSSWQRFNIKKSSIASFYVNTEKLFSNKKFYQRWIPSELSYPVNYFSDFHNVIGDINFGTPKASVTIKGAGYYKNENLDFYKNFYTKLPLGKPKMWDLLSNGVFLQTTFQVNLQNFWSKLLEEQDIEYRKQIQNELVLFNKEILDKKDFARDFLPLLGPEWGIALVNVNYQDWDLKPKYPLPVFIMFLELKDKWAGEKLLEMLYRAISDMETTLRKKGEEMPIKLIKEQFKEEIFVQVKLETRDAKALGKAFDPAFIIKPDRLIVCSWAPLIKKKEVGQIYVPTARDFHSGIFIDVNIIQKVLENFKDTIAQTMVNNKFRREIEPIVEKTMSAKYGGTGIERLKNEIRGRLNQKDFPNREEFEKAVINHLSKYLYSERIQLIQDELGQFSQTQLYIDELKLASVEVERIIKILSFLDKITFTTKFTNEYTKFDGNILLHFRN